MTESIAGLCRRWLPAPVAVASALASWITVATVAGAFVPAFGHGATYQPDVAVLTMNVAQRSATSDADRPHLPAGPRGSAGMVGSRRLAGSVVAPGASAHRLSTGDRSMPHQPVLIDGASRDQLVGGVDRSLTAVPANRGPVLIPSVVHATAAGPSHDGVRAVASTGSGYPPEPDVTSVQTRGP